MEDRSCRPKRVGQPTYSLELVVAVQGLRQEYPRWDKDKLVVLLDRPGFSCSASTVDRIINSLKAHGVLNEPIRNHVSAHRRGMKRPYVIRRPAAHFLNALEERMPFLVKAIQVDGDAEFEAVFEEECQKGNIKLFVLLPDSPELNGYVERAHLTHTEKFYEVTASSFNIPGLTDKLLNWKKLYIHSVLTNLWATSLLRSTLSATRKMEESR